MKIEEVATIIIDTEDKLTRGETLTQQEEAIIVMAKQLSHMANTLDNVEKIKKELLKNNEEMVEAIEKIRRPFNR